MERSIAARYAARPAARFVTTSTRARERRLGLRGAGSFRPASTRMTVLRRPSDSILARLRGDWRAIRPAHPRRTDGRPRPAVAMTWTGTAVAASGRRSSAATAPWRG
ncbi:MAG TPA: hypothetical protein VFI34_00985 [Candidatus Limnocylindrales bacterium]|nr:hypothetical protein [Candidatus Limnocylindrales bacterium]